MRKLFLALLPLTLLANCKAPAEQANPDRFHKPAPVDVAGANGPGNSKTQAPNAGEPMSPLNKDGTPKNSFPAGVVQRLNAIVLRSKTAVDAWDKLRPGLQAAIKAKDDGKVQASVAALADLHKQAASAKADLGKEGQALLDAGQYYDTVIFSGMAKFATKVEDELARNLKSSQDAVTK